MANAATQPTLTATGQRLPSIFASRQVLLVLINAAIILTLGVLRPDAFLSWTNFKAVLSLMSYDLLIAVAMTVVLIVRGLDLSVGSVLALTSVVLALLLREGFPVVPSLFASLLVALLCGFVNGFLVARIGILPFLATLGMMSIARGIATVLTTGQYISFPTAPRWFTGFSRSELGFSAGEVFYGVPMLLATTLGVTFIFGVLLVYWAPLRQAFYVGESPEAARLTGLRVDRITISAYLMSAVFVWIAAVLMTSANKIGYANYGITAELRALAAAVIGGASLAGGSGSIFGTFLGVLLLALIGNGFILLNGSPNWQQATVGVVLIAAVGFDAIRTYGQRS
jgi:ribose transport system permease protein